MTTLIRAKTILTLEDKDHIHQPGFIVIENNRIVEIGQSERLNPSRHFDATIDLPDRLLMPGLINALFSNAGHICSVGGRTQIVGGPCRSLFMQLSERPFQ